VADNNNAQAIRVVNEKIRPAADRIVQTYNFMKDLQAQYGAQNWAALFPATADVVLDGSAVDGRNPLTNADVANVITALGAFLAFMEATANLNRDRFLKAAVNPER